MCDDLVLKMIFDRLFPACRCGDDPRVGMEKGKDVWRSGFVRFADDEVGGMGIEYDPMRAAFVVDEDPGARSRIAYFRKLSNTHRSQNTGKTGQTVMDLNHSGSFRSYLLR